MLTLLGSMKPWPLERQKSLTLPSLTSDSILPVMECVLVLRVMMTSGSRRPSGSRRLPDVLGEVMVDERVPVAATVRNTV